MGGAQVALPFLQTGPKGASPLRSLWKGTISFGLVTIPVRLYAATEDQEIRFNQLHAPCHSRIKYQKYCPVCQREVRSDEIIKGYAYEPDRYVIIEEAELASLPAAAKHTIELLDFVKLSEIDPIYFQKTYYLEPAEGGAKAYQLLLRALTDTGQIGIAQVAIRAKASLAAVRVFQGQALALETMFYPAELRSVQALAATGQEVAFRPGELELAVQLIGSLSRPFEPGRYTNAYQAELRRLIEAKVAGQQLVQAPEVAPSAEVADLLEALKESVRRAQTPSPEILAGVDGPAAATQEKRPGP